MIPLGPAHLKVDLKKKIQRCDSFFLHFKSRTTISILN